MNPSDKRNIVAIVQARMGASRLPNKMMLWLHGYPVIEWVRQRVRKATKIDTLVFAVPDTPLDEVMAVYLEQKGENVFRGDEQDVLNRFFGAAQEFQATHIVRVCADNPFISPEEIDNLVEFYFDHSCDYAYNHIPKNNTYPDGLGAEIVSMELLETIYVKAKVVSLREHIFNYIWDTPDEFSIKTFDPPNSLIAHPEVKLDIDTVDDYLKLLAVPVEINMDAVELVSLFREKK